MEHATLQWLDTACGPYAVIVQADGALTIDGQYKAVSLKKMAADEWLLVGALK